MKVFDMHCDTISAIYEKRKSKEAVELRKNNLHLDIEKMRLWTSDFCAFCRQGGAKRQLLYCAGDGSAVSGGN